MMIGVRLLRPHDSQMVFAGCWNWFSLSKASIRVIDEHQIGRERWAKVRYCVLWRHNRILSFILVPLLYITDLYLGFIFVGK